MTCSIRRCSCCTVPADTVVPYHQSVKMRDRLAEHGVDAQLVLVDGAEHEYDFWSQQVFDVIFDFIRERS